MANDDLAEVSALAETLRATITTLDQRIEQRARQLAAERGPLTPSSLPIEVPLLAQRLADLMRRVILEHSPDREAVSMSSEEATAHAASFLASAYRQMASDAEAKLEQQRG